MLNTCRHAESGRALNGSAASSLNLLRDAELLPGWYDDWVLFEQSRLRQDRLYGFHIIGRESLARREFEVSLEASEAAIELEPLYESAVGILIQAQRNQGNNAAALRAFNKYRTKLKEDMGLAPSEGIRRLVATFYESWSLRELGMTMTHRDGSSKA